MLPSSDSSLLGCIPVSSEVSAMSDRGGLGRRRPRPPSASPSPPSRRRHGLADVTAALPSPPLSRRRRSDCFPPGFSLSSDALPLPATSSDMSSPVQVPVVSMPLSFADISFSDGFLINGSLPSSGPISPLLGSSDSSPAIHVLPPSPVY
jgi:hypothetical protein